MRQMRPKYLGYSLDTTTGPNLCSNHLYESRKKKQVSQLTTMRPQPEILSNSQDFIRNSKVTRVILIFRMAILIVSVSSFQIKCYLPKESET